VKGGKGWGWGYVGAGDADEVNLPFEHTDEKGTRLKFWQVNDSPARLESERKPREPKLPSGKYRGTHLKARWPLQLREETRRRKKTRKRCRTERLPQEEKIPTYKKAK